MNTPERTFRRNDAPFIHDQDHEPLRAVHAFKRGGLDIGGQLGPVIRVT